MHRKPPHTTEALLELMFLCPRDRERMLSLARQAASTGRGRPRKGSPLQHWLHWT
jgi:hypothetical protein